MAEALKIDLDEETSARLEVLRRQRDVSVEDLVRGAVADFLEREEALAREYAEDDARWAEYLANGRTISNEDAFAWLRSIGTDEEGPCPR